jgi:hypothetical protein
MAKEIIDIGNNSNINPTNLKGKLNNPFNGAKAKLKAKRAQNAEDLKERLAERKKRKEELREDLKNIKNNDPDKPKGLAALKKIVQVEGTKMVEQMVPTITQLAIQMGLEALLNKANEALPSCPPKKIVDEALIPLNGVVSDLNATIERIDKIAKLGTFTSDSLKTVQKVANVLNIAIPAISGASKSIAIIPGFIVSALDDLDYFRNLILYNNNGSPRLPKITGQINAIFAATGLVSAILKRITIPLQGIIDKLNECYPELSDQFPTLSDKVKEYAALGENNFEEEEPISYNGFIIEIEEVPFTPTVNRFRAIGYNSYGVPLIKGELSFTPNNAVLVNELKFIIDQDNLSSY